MRDIGISQATYSRLFFVALDTDRRRWPPPSSTAFGGVAAIDGTLAVGTVVALTAYLTRLYGPLTQLSNVNLDVMTALVSFERLFEVLDIVPMIERLPTPSTSPGAAPRSSSTTSSSPTRAPRTSRWPRSNRWRCSSQACAARSSTTSPSRWSPARWWPWSARRARARPPSPSLVPRLYDVTAGTVRLNGDRRAPGHHGLAARRGGRGDPGPAPLPRHAAGQPPLRPARGHRGRAPRRPGPGPDRPPRRRAARRARHRDRRARATASRAARSSGWPWPASSSRHPTWWCSTRRRPTSTPSPRRPSSAPCARR